MRFEIFVGLALVGISLSFGDRFAAAADPGPGDAMANCIRQQARALENKDIDAYMAYVHPEAPDRIVMAERVRVGMRLGPNFVIAVLPGAPFGNSMDVQMSFVQGDGVGMQINAIIRVEFRDHEGKPLIWKKTTRCSECRNGRQIVTVRKIAGIDPATGNQFFFDTQKTVVCPTCGGSSVRLWRDEP